MSRKSLVEQINLIENNYDVDNVKCNNVRIWPYLRAYFHLYRLLKIKNDSGAPDKSRKYLQSFNSFLKLIYSSCEYFFLNRKMSVFKLKPVDILMIFDNNGKVQRKSDMKWMNKFSDSFIELLPKDTSSLNIEYSDTHNFYHPRLRKSYYINPYYFIFSIGQFFKKSNINIEGLNELIDYIDSKKIKLSVDKNQVNKRLYKVFQFKRFFIRILNKTKPNLVVFPVYYSNLNFGLQLACNELGIRTMEIQHGQQGDYHPAYSNWNNYPEKKYILHPDIFWMWGKNNVDRINSWASNHHFKVFNGGNTWIWYYQKYLKEKVSQKPIVSKEIPKRILVALQFPQDFLNSFVIDRMKKNVESEFWLLRLHPNQMEKLNVIKYYLEEHGCKNFDIELASSLPLYELFDQVNYCLTFWSTVAYEADIFGLKTIIAHPNGKVSMANYIENNVFAYTQDDKSLEEALYSFDYKKSPTPYIHADEELMKRSIAELMILNKSNN